MSKKIQSVKIFTDGASRGNPGNSAWAYLILDNRGSRIASQSGYIGRSTNNQAEYFAVIRSLQRASEITGKHVSSFSDSKLVVNQLSGNWRVKNSELKRLFHRAKGLIERFESVHFEHVPRNQKNLAQVDHMCNSTLDEIEKY